MVQSWKHLIVYLDPPSEISTEKDSSSFWWLTKAVVRLLVVTSTDNSPP